MVKSAEPIAGGPVMAKEPARKKSLTRRKNKTQRNGAMARTETVLVMRPTSSLRGLMPIPPEVEKIVAGIERERPMSPTARQRTADGLSEQYYFGDQYIAYRHTPQGKEVLAVGSDEIDQLNRRRMSRAERERMVLGYAEPWYEEVPKSP
jgi:hypothetical protein